MFNIQDFQQGMSLKDFGLAVSLGSVAGISDNVKFGYASSISALGSVWPEATPYVFPIDAGQAIEVLSDNAADTGIDLRVFTIDAVTGLDAEQIVTLNGVTPVLVPGGNVRAVNRAFNGNGTVFQGKITVRGTGAPNANIFAIVLAEDQQTTQTPVMIPDNKVAVINNYSTAINKSGGADVSSIMRLVIQRVGKVARTQIRYGLQRSGVSNISSDLIVPIPVPPLAKITVTSDPSAVADISAEYSMWMIDKDLIDPVVLAAIIDG